MKTEITLKFTLEHGPDLPTWEIGDEPGLLEHLADQAELYLTRQYCPLHPLTVTKCPVAAGSYCEDDPASDLDPLYASVVTVED